MDAPRFARRDEPDGVERDFALGLHVPGVWGKVLDVRSCGIQFEAADPILQTVHELARELGLSAWDTRAHTGLLRHLLLRHAPTTGQLLVDLVTSADADDELTPFFDELRARHPEITTCVQNVTTRPAQVAVGEYERVIWGPGHIVEELDGGGPRPLQMRVSANSPWMRCSVSRMMRSQSGSPPALWAFVFTSVQISLRRCWNAT